MTDDRKKFLKNITLQSNKLGKNKNILNQSIKFLKNVDDYDYSYLWTWFGVPIIQLPADIMVMQEILYKIKPDVVIETGVARGGSLLFYASILKLIKKKFKIIGIDVDIRQHNKKSIKNSIFSRYIKLIQSSSTDSNIKKKINKYVKKKNKILVILDSNHTKKHVLEECKIYSKFVSKNSYLVIADTIIGFLKNNEMPKKRSIVLKKGNEPLSALKDFLKINKKFKVDKTLNGKLIFSSNYNGFLKKIR